MPFRGGLCLVICLLFLSGVLCGGWHVVYTPPDVCALVGSTMYVNCTYTYPMGLQVDNDFWSKGCESVTDHPEPLTLDLGSRLEYLGNQEDNCSLKIKDLRQNDSSIYCFSFITNTTGGAWTEKPGVTLNVTGLHVFIPSNPVTEGDRVTLTCNTTCTLTNNPTYIWYLRKGLVNSTLSTMNKTLTLDPVSREDAGNYSCAVRGYEEHPSPAAPLSVRYAPDNTTASASPTCVTSGGLVTLTCSSDANPPVQIYTWYTLNGHGTSPVGAGETTYVTLSDNGVYFCEARNEVGSQNSTTLKLNSADLHVLIDPKDAVEGSRVTLTCSTTCTLTNNPTYFWSKKRDKVSIIYITQSNTLTLDSVSREDAGNYSCAVRGYPSLEAPLFVTWWNPWELSVIIILPLFALTILALVVVVCCWWRKTNKVVICTEDGKQNSDALYCNVIAMTPDPARPQMTPEPVDPKGHQQEEEETPYANT